LKLVAKPIDAVVIFRDREKPRPYKFRYIDSFGDPQEIKVEKIISIYEQRIPGAMGYVYECQSTKGMNQYRYELRFNPSDLSWMLYKI